MQAIICVTMAYEAICSTARAAVVQGNVVYVPQTMVEYLALIHRSAHLAYVAAVAVVVAGNLAMPPAIPYSEALADSHDQLQNAFNFHVAVVR